MKGRRTALLLDNTVFLALVIPRGAMITSLSTAQPLLTVALRHNKEQPASEMPTSKVSMSAQRALGLRAGSHLVVAFLARILIPRADSIHHLLRPHCLPEELDTPRLI